MNVSSWWVWVPVGAWPAELVGVARDDLEAPGAGFGNGCRHFRPLIAAVGIDHLDEWEPSPGAAQQLASPVCLPKIPSALKDETW